MKAVYHFIPNPKLYPRLLFHFPYLFSITLDDIKINPNFTMLRNKLLRLRPVLLQPEDLF